MEEYIKELDFSLLFVVVNDGEGCRVCRLAQTKGVRGGTISHGHGILKNRLLAALDLNVIRREVVLMVTSKAVADDLLPQIGKEFHLAKKYSGVAAIVNVKRFIGSAQQEPGKREEGKDAKGMYNVIYVVVNRGKGEDVIESALKAGAEGGTIINARGSGIHETCKLFSVDIEPEKEIVLFITTSAIKDAIIPQLNKDMKLEEPGNGVLFVLEAEQVYGLT